MFSTQYQKFNSSFHQLKNPIAHVQNSKVRSSLVTAPKPSTADVSRELSFLHHPPHTLFPSTHYLLSSFTGDI
jgi:hypothetical protein